MRRHPGRRPGTGLVFRQILTGLIGAHDRLGPADRVRLGHTAIDLAAAVIAQHAEHTSSLPPETRRQALFHEITRFITLHLGDPGLKPAAIAAAHFISTRYLHRVFQCNGTTVNGFIRQARISRCRRDLADPRCTPPRSRRSAPAGASPAPRTSPGPSGPRPA